MLRRRRASPSPDPLPPSPAASGLPPAEPAPPVRWTEHGPEGAAAAEVTDVEPAVVAEAPVAPESEDLDAVRARLAARGLVRTEPSVRIRDLAGGRPDPEPAPIVPNKGDPFEPPTPAEDAVGDDAEALEPEPFGPKSTVRCPSCRTTQQVADDATGYRCDNCTKVWRWGVCTSCDHVSLTIARQESWRCTSCGAYSRSWWRTATAPREAQEVTRRRRAEAAQREHERVLAVARRRRWKLLLAGVVVIALAGVSALIYSSDDAASPAERTRATCNTWTSLKSDIANGALSGPQIDAALADLAAGAELADNDVALAAGTVADAGRPGTATYLVASTQLSDACAASRP